MRAVRGDDGGVRLADLDEPPGAGELVEVVSVSICASDLRYLTLGTRKVIGHEVAGITADGTPVIVDGLASCGHCDWCDSGQFNLCPEAGARILGLTADGGMAEYYRVPRHWMTPVPDGLSLADASLAEPGAVAWHACRKGGVSGETRVLVVGAGAIGLLAVLAARAQGAPEVAVAARHPFQREAGLRLGAAEPDGQYDVVIETSGTESGLADAVQAARPLGTVSTVSVFPADVRWPYRAAFLKEVCVVPSMGYGADPGGREIGQVAAMLAAAPEITKTLISHRFGLEEAPQAFAVAAARPAGTFRVVVHPERALAHSGIIL
jgi:threonine dehydrogenase-like Zn-dependent dehydrogenase